MTQLTFRERYEAFQTFVRNQKTKTLLEKPLSRWTHENDKHLPQKQLNLSMIGLSEISFDELLKIQGIGERKIEKLIELVERVITKIENDARSDKLDFTEILNLKEEKDLYFTDSVVSQYPLSEEERWEKAITFLKRVRFDDQTIGSLAVSLKDIPSNFWGQSLGDFAKMSFNEIKTIPGFGDKKFSIIINLIESVQLRLQGLQDIDKVSIIFRRSEIEKILNWSRKCLSSSICPTLNEINENLLLPLLSLIQDDLNETILQVISLRIGIEREPQTLNEIGAYLGLTRERVRQLENNARNLLNIRWPEGGLYLEALMRHISRMTETEPQLTILRSISKVCFDSTFSLDQTDRNLISKWRAAGKSYLTPMTEEEFSAWLSKSVGDYPLAKAIESLTERGLKVSDPRDVTFFLSDTKNDKILRAIIENPTLFNANAISSELKITMNELHKRIKSDPRIILDDYKNPRTLDYISMFKNKNGYHLELFSLNDRMGSTILESISIDELIDLITQSLPMKGIFDATVWGVYRYISESISSNFNGKISPNITPLILASILVNFSDGKIRIMRRRRLRWDLPGLTQGAIGKTGWINLIMKTERRPLTLDELDERLKVHYQDYNSHVIQQLPKYYNESDEGITDRAYTFFEGIPRVIPAIIIPIDWDSTSSDITWSNGINQISQLVSSLPSDSEALDVARTEIPWIIRNQNNDSASRSASIIEEESLLQTENLNDIQVTSEKPTWSWRFWRK